MRNGEPNKGNDDGEAHFARIDDRNSSVKDGALYFALGRPEGAIRNGNAGQTRPARDSESPEKSRPEGERPNSFFDS